MELDELRKEWQELNDRLERLESLEHLERPGGGSRRSAARRTADFRRRTERRLLIPTIGALMIPPLIMSNSALMGWEPGVVCIVSMVLLAAVAVAEYTSVQAQLRRLDPLYDTVSETCRKIHRMKRQWLWSKPVNIVVAVVLLTSLFDGFRHSPLAPYAVKGFWLGIALGVPVGISLFIRIYTDFVDMERLFNDAD